MSCECNVRSHLRSNKKELIVYDNSWDPPQKHVYKNGRWITFSNGNKAIHGKYWYPSRKVFYQQNGYITKTKVLKLQKEMEENDIESDEDSLKVFVKKKFPNFSSSKRRNIADIIYLEGSEAPDEWVE